MTRPAAGRGSPVARPAGDVVPGRSYFEDISCTRARDASHRMVSMTF
jgi:hypothetical protein